MLDVRKRSVLQITHHMRRHAVDAADLRYLKLARFQKLSLRVRHGDGCIGHVLFQHSHASGIIGTAANLNVPLQIIPTEEIENLDISQLGIQTSEFVASQTGVLSVSTACSYLASSKGTILRDKAKYKGITIALSKERS